MVESVIVISIFSILGIIILPQITKTVIHTEKKLALQNIMSIKREDKPVEKKPIEEKNGMKITDNMDGQAMADEKLMAGANGTINISKYKKWKKLYESGGNMRKAGIILNPAESKAFLKLYKKGN